MEFTLEDLYYFLVGYANDELPITHYELMRILECVVKSQPAGLTKYHLSLIKLMCGNSSHGRKKLIARQILKNIVAPCELPFGDEFTSLTSAFYVHCEDF